MTNLMAWGVRLLTKAQKVHSVVLISSVHLKFTVSLLQRKRLVTSVSQRKV